MNAKSSTPKRRSYFRVWLFGTLFVLWVGWLGYLALTASNFPIVSRAQVSVTSVIVVAELSNGTQGRPSGSVRIVEVLFPEDDSPLTEDENVEIRRLAQCDNKRGWQGTGRYILPLEREEARPGYRLTGIPVSPGYAANEPRIYPDTEIVRQQIRTYLAPRQE